MTKCPRCKVKMVERLSDFAKMGLAEPGFMKRNKVMECVKCGELWYKGKPNVADVNPKQG